MKLGQKPSKIWHETKELKSGFSKLTSQIDRLILLESFWSSVAAGKAKFWVLYGVNVKTGTIFVKVNVMAARHELILKEAQLITELNKNFDKPWINKISIV